jgi:hypothetical protein
MGNITKDNKKNNENDSSKSNKQRINRQDLIKSPENKNQSNKAS